MKPVIASVIVAAMTSAAGPPPLEQSVPLPRGAREFPPDDKFDPQAPPWVFVHVRARTAPAPVLAGTGESLRTLFDDGSTGTMRVEADPCLRNQTDCIWPSDRFAVVVRDKLGQPVSHVNFWSGYGKFAVTPVDLVGGRGDELVVMTSGRGSPPPGEQMEIWSLRPTPSRLLDTTVEGSVPAQSINCVRWRYDVMVDLAAVKPRPIVLRGRVGYRGDCVTDREGAAKLREVLEGQTLRFTGRAYSRR